MLHKQGKHISCHKLATNSFAHPDRTGLDTLFFSRSKFQVPVPVHTAFYVSQLSMYSVTLVTYTLLRTQALSSLVTFLCIAAFYVLSKTSGDAWLRILLVIVLTSFYGLCHHHHRRHHHHREDLPRIPRFHRFPLHPMQGCQC